ncbi:MAG: hypothetical protein ABL927_02280 [Bdellovibrionales bacterium]
MVRLILIICGLVISSVSFGQVLQVNPADISFKYTQIKSLGISSGYNIQVYVGNDLVYVRPYFNFASLEQAKIFVDQNALTTIGLAKQEGKKIKLDITSAKSGV